MSLTFINIDYSDSILSCSDGCNYAESEYYWNADGPVYGPNGQWELDPDLPSSQCQGFTRPVFATCKNNCPGGELISSRELQHFEYQLFYLQLISQL